MKRPRQMKVPEPQPEAISVADYGLFEGDEEPPNLEQDRGAEQHGHCLRSFGLHFRFFLPLQVRGGSQDYGLAHLFDLCAGIGDGLADVRGNRVPRRSHYRIPVLVGWL